LESERRAWSKTKGITAIIIVYASIVAILLVNANFNKPQVTLTGLGLTGNVPCSPCISFFGSTIRNGSKTDSLLGGDQFNVTTISVHQGSQIHKITNITILSPGFTLISAFPSLPIVLNPKHHTKITIMVEAPFQAYTGLLVYQMTVS
jgi:hypothetical protein